MFLRLLLLHLSEIPIRESLCEREVEKQPRRSARSTGTVEPQASKQATRFSSCCSYQLIRPCSRIHSDSRLDQASLLPFVRSTELHFPYSIHTPSPSPSRIRNTSIHRLYQLVSEKAILTTFLLVASTYGAIYCQSSPSIEHILSIASVLAVSHLRLSTIRKIRICIESQS